MPFADSSEIEILRSALESLDAGFDRLPQHERSIDTAAIASVLQDVAVRMRNNFPYHHPRYAGQMLKPPHPVARLAYALSMWLNPNNHALDGGRASSEMEKECVEALARMCGWTEALGHLCGGGTMANLEALWVAGRLAPGRRVVASTQAHYTHARISDVLKLDFATVEVTGDGRMDVDALRSLLRAGDVGTVVATLGTTGMGAVDPLPEILELQQEYSFRVHADAAYGGYFCLASELGPDAARAFARIADADSIVIDPHKHGLQPYGCGCVLFRDPGVGALYRHESPYTYFSSVELHLGEISLECSRPGAAAVALWATQQLLPMVPGEARATDLDRSLLAARSLWQGIDESEHFYALAPPALDIVVFSVKAEDAVSASEHAREIFKRAAARDLHLALIDLPAELVAPFCTELDMNRRTVTCLRSCLMKPEHLDWIDDIQAILEEVARDLRHIPP